MVVMAIQRESGQAAVSEALRMPMVLFVVST
jgi:hypothetical protein